MKSSQRMKAKIRRKLRNLVFCQYQKTHDHMIKNYTKLVAKDAKKKEASMVVVDTSFSTIDFANVVQGVDQELIVQCSHDPLMHDSCMSIVNSNMWFFDTGTTKHITLWYSFFITLESI